MAEPLTIAANLVSGILNMVAGAKTNRADCEQLGIISQNVLNTLERLPKCVLVDPSLEKAVETVNRCLRKAQDAIRECLDTSFFCALFSHHIHSCALKEALVSLQMALVTIPVAVMAKTVETHSRVHSMSDRQHRQRFSDEANRQLQKLHFQNQIDRALSRARHDSEQHKKDLTLDLTALIHPEMYQNPLKMTTQVVEGISRRVKRVKTNNKGCSWLAKRGVKALTILKEFESDIMHDVGAVNALLLANSALTKVQDAIEDCCSVNRFSTLSRRDRYSMALRSAAKELHDALSAMPVVNLGIPDDRKSELDTLLDELLHGEFNEALIYNQRSIPTCRPSETIHECLPGTSEYENPQDTSEEGLNVDSSSYEQFGPAFNLVRNITSNVQDARTHHDGCYRLETLAKRTFLILEHLELGEVDSVVTTWLGNVASALTEANTAIINCCDANIFKLALNHSDNSETIKKSEETLKKALSEAPLNAHEIGVIMQSEIVDLTDQVNRGRLEERAKAVQKMKSFKVALETGLNRNIQENEEIKQIIHRAKEDQDRAREELKKEIEKSTGELVESKDYIATQSHLAPNQINQTDFESFDTASETMGPKKNLKESMLCPISKEHMRDPVMLKEIGTTYDRSSIEEWFRRGHRYDPLTNVELASQDLVPNVAFRNMCESWLELSGNPILIQNVLKEDTIQPRLLSGLYDGHGRFNINGLEMQVCQTLLLEPDGRALGYTLYGSQKANVQGQKLEVGSGKWNSDTLSFSFEDGWYHYQGRFDLGTDQKHAKIEWKGDVATNDMPYNTHRSTFFYSVPPITKVVRTRPGILQMEGAKIARQGGDTYMSKVLLSLGIDNSINGWMWFESVAHEIDCIGHIRDGEWDLDGSLTFQVKFSPKRVFSIAGIIAQSGRFFESTFSARATKRTSNALSTDEQHHPIPLDDEPSLEYPYLRQTSPLFSHVFQSPSRLLQESKDHELESGEYFIGTDFDDGYGPIPYYLHVWTWHSDFISTPDVHVSWHSCSPINGKPYWHCAEVWQVERDPSTNKYRIALSKTHRNKTERNVHIGKSLHMWLADDSHIDHGDCYLCVRNTPRIEDKNLWTIKKCQGGLCLVLEGYQDSSITGATTHFLSLPILERDRRHEHTRYAPLSESPERALKITFEPPQY